MKNLPQDTVIDEFVHFLGRNCHPGLQIIDWPDKRNRNGRDIDAIAGTNRKKIAIEHTSFDALENQRRDADWFMKTVGDLELELKGEIPYRLNLWVPYKGVQKGMDWKTIKATLRKWIIESAAQLSDGQATQCIPDVPFEITTIKSTSRPPGLFLGRLFEDDKTFVPRINSIILGKASKLSVYKKGGHLTILLMENSDTALRAIDIIKQAVSKVVCPISVDEIWYADTSLPSAVGFWPLTPKSS